MKTNRTPSEGITPARLRSQARGSAIKAILRPAPLILSFLWFGFCDSATGIVRYVNVNSATPAAPYTNWPTAATTIQAAVDAAVAGDEIVVTNGVYAAGGRAVYGTMTNRVAVTKPLIVRSENGPLVTIIEGYQVPGVTNGNGAIRCVYLTNGAALLGFTLTKGGTRATGDSSRERSGGAVLGASGASLVSNCVLAGNSASYRGGGACYGTLTNCQVYGNSAQQGGGAYNAVLNNCTAAGNSASSGGAAYEASLNNCTVSANSADAGGAACYGSFNNCLVTGNRASYGGAAYQGRLNNCTVTGNSAEYGGGSHSSTLFNCTVTGNRGQMGGGALRGTLINCIVYYNSGGGGNYTEASLTYCCTTPLPADGTGNIEAEPQLASASHLSASSPCRGAGSASDVSGLDIDGEPWANPPSIGCDEFWSGSVTGELSVAILADYTNMTANYPVSFQAIITGNTSASAWDFGDGTVISNRPFASHAWAAAGDYPVVLRAYNESAPSGVAATLLIHVENQAVHYVALDSATPTAPYRSWATAATNIQDAVDAAWPGALVLVSNGVYQTGSRVVYGMSNRLAVSRALMVQSVNGPGVTAIQGYQVPGTTNGAAAVRCVYLTNGAVLAGFTLTNGATQGAGADSRQQSGGGVWCESPDALVTNCVVVGNSAHYGGGTHGGTLNNCRLSGNWAGIEGGAARSSVLNNCAVTGNSALSYAGGGASSSTLNNCALSGNWANYYGGAAFRSTLNNCTLVGNSASLAGGGAYSALLNNCILYYNAAAGGANYDDCTFNYSATTPLPAGGIGNVSVEPDLASFSHLSASSPCIGKGSHALTSGADIDGEPWVNPPSMGCDEYHGGSATGLVTVAIVAGYSNVATGFTVDFQALIDGQVSASRWEFGDGTILSNRPFASHAWSVAGDYSVVLRAYNDSNPDGVTASTAVQVVAQPVHYVALNNPTPVAPYSSWATAAANIQEAVDAASTVGALVLVSNGVYATGSRAVGTNLLLNRVAVNKPVTLLSVNGPALTTITGYRVPGITNGNAAVRCVYLANGAALAGFTLTNGATRTNGDYGLDRSGGGVWCQSSRAVVSNCVLTGNAASSRGGGVYGGTVNDSILRGNCAGIGGGTTLSLLNGCTLIGNRAYSEGGGAIEQSTANNCTFTGNSAPQGGAAWWSSLNGCTLSTNVASYGGGACASALNDCLLFGNSARYGGGAEGGSVLNHCTLTGNSAELGGGANASRLEGCTLAGNSATNAGGATYGSRLFNCTLTTNWSKRSGGGAAAGTLSNCVLAGNRAPEGGGADGATLTNCTLTGNSAGSGGGASSGTLYNCIVYFNTATNGANYDHYSSLDYCCTTPLPTNGLGNISLDPQLASTSHLSANSPCLGRGNYGFASGLDIDGEPWANPPSIGCDEPWSGSVTGALSVAMLASHTYVAVGFSVDFQTLIAGRLSGSSWNFGDGTVLSNRPYASHAWTAVGDYAVTLRAYNETYPAGVAVTGVVSVVEGIYYVAAGSAHPVAPYTSWANAAANLQDALDAVAVPGAQVLVSNGVYAAGGRTVGTSRLSNRAAVEKAIRVCSVNGPQFTIIEGRQVPGATNGVGAVRCVYLAAGASLSGFTLTNGATRTDGNSPAETRGGGAWCQSPDTVISNCVLRGNSAYSDGGGAYSGTLINCTLTGNRTDNNGGGAANATLMDCTLSGNTAAIWGGGARGGTLNRCRLSGNSASYGGGCAEGVLNDCALSGNSATMGGGGASWCTLNNCTATGNSVSYLGGGTYAGTLHNCIIYYNTSTSGGENYSGGTLDHCCTTPLPPDGSGNIATEPLFVDLAGGNLRLQTNSPCINAGTNTYASSATDLDGRPRIVNRTVDIGAYEFQGPGMGEFIAWLGQCGLPTDGAADYVDGDADGHNNWQEWRCLTDPTSSLSALRLLSASPDGANITVRWQSVPGVTYFLECSTNLATPPCFVPRAAGIPGQAGTTSFTDTNAADLAPQRFYRVGVAN